MTALPKSGPCALCERELSLTFHHLIPRKLHRNKWIKKNHTRDQMNDGIDLCADCHSAIHRFASEKELGRQFNTRDKLLDHPQIGRFVEWVRKRQPGGRVRTRPPRLG